MGSKGLPNDIKQPSDTEEEENETRHHMTKQYRTRHDKMRQTGLETSQCTFNIRITIENVH